MVEVLVTFIVVAVTLAVLVPVGLGYLLLRQVRMVRPLACTVVMLLGLAMGPVGLLAATAGICWVQWDGRRGAGRPRPPSASPRLGRAWAVPLREACAAGERCHRAVATAAAGPLRDRLDDLLADVDRAVGEAERLAVRGSDIAGARREVDVALARQRRGGRAEGAIGDALAAQEASAARLRAAEDAELGRLHVLVARLQQLAAQIVELTVLPAPEPGALAELNDEVAALQAATHEVAMADAGLRPATVPV